MVIKGGSRAGGGNLAVHLLRTDTNERAEVVELKGVAAHRLPEALAEMEAVASGTRCRKSLYHASLNTGPGEELTLEQKAAAVARLELALGLEGHARAVVEHRKEGRDHLHVVWSRIDVDTMRAVHDGHNFRRHEEVARELEKEFGHNRVQGAHHEREGPEGKQPRPPRTPSPGDVQQATRTKRELGDVAADLTRLWQRTDSGPAFVAALAEAGYELARGDRRGFCVVDQAGGVHSLARRIEGAKTKDVASRLAGIELDSLPSADQARARQRDRQADREHAPDLQGDRRADPAPAPAQKPARDPQADFRTEPDRPQAPETAHRAAEAVPTPEALPEAAKPAQASPNRQEDRTRHRPTVQPSTGKDAARAAGKAAGLAGEGAVKATRGAFGLLGSLLGGFFKGVDAMTGRGGKPAETERERPQPQPQPQPAPQRQPAPPPPKAPAPRPPSVFDEIRDKIREQEARNPKPTPQPEKDRDRGRGMEFRPIGRLAAIVSGRETHWPDRLIAYGQRAEDYLASQLHELEAFVYRALHGPA